LIVARAGPFGFSSRAGRENRSSARCSMGSEWVVIEVAAAMKEFLDNSR
jgi:hypothetical protein